MTQPSTIPTPNWRNAFAIAVALHAGLGLAVVVPGDAPVAPEPVPVMVIELPAGAPPPPAQQAVAEPDAPPVPQELPDMVAPRLDVPQVDAPLPPDPVIVPRPAPAPRIVPQVRRQPPAETRPVANPAPPAAPPAAGTARAAEGTGDNPRASEEAQDWYALVSAHLERNKRYPREARRDGLEGTPLVRFTVNRRGRVTDISIRESSGHALLDEATIELMRRVSPLPPMPRAMQRESVTITLPIEYSLGRK